MKQWIIQKLVLNSPLWRTTFIAGGFLWSTLLFPAAYVVFKIQLSYFNQMELERRNAIQQLLVSTFNSASRFGDLVNARGMVLRLARPLGVVDIGICKGKVDILPRAFENRCVDLPIENSVLLNNEIAIRFYWSDIKVNWNLLIIKTILMTFFFGFIMFLITSYFYYFILKKRIHHISQKIISENDESMNLFDSNSVPEMQPIVDALKDYRTKINDYHLEKQKLENAAMFSSIARQVSHDIRSPISALNMLISNFNGISEEQKDIIRQVSFRINSIANDLLESTKLKTTKISRTDISFFQLEKNLREILNEKTIEYRNFDKISIELRITGDISQIWIPFDANEFKRILSNLINNSIEAFNSEGNIVVETWALKKKVNIRIIDNGSGIPETILAKLTTEQISSKNNGAGIGIYSATEVLKRYGHTLSIVSREGIGTQVLMTFHI